MGREDERGTLLIFFVVLHRPHISRTTAHTHTLFLKVERGAAAGWLYGRLFGGGVESLHGTIFIIIFTHTSTYKFTYLTFTIFFTCMSYEAVYLRCFMGMSCE